MMDLKVMGAALSQLEEERGIPKEKIIEAIEQALAAAYKKDYGKKGQIIRASFDVNSGSAEFSQVKIVVSPDEVRMPEEFEEEEEDQKDEAEGAVEEKDERVRFNPEHHMLLSDAQRIKKDAQPGDEIAFPLETRDDYGRIAAQTAKQVIIQRIREAEKVSVTEEFGKKQGDIVSGTVQRIERGTIFVDLGKATGIIPYDEQIPGERYRQGERIRAYLYSVEESPKGIHLRLSRSHPRFLEKLFEQEVPEIQSGTVELKAVAREAGSRSKMAVFSHDEHIDPVGSCVGQRGLRVSTVMSELGGEKIDIIEWSDEPEKFIEDALSPAKALEIEVDDEEKAAIVRVAEDQLSLAIGRGGQNVRLAAKLTGWKIDVQGAEGEHVAESDGESVEVEEDALPSDEEDAREEHPEENAPEAEAPEADTSEGAPEEENAEAEDAASNKEESTESDEEGSEEAEPENEEKEEAESEREEEAADEKKTS